MKRICSSFNLFAPMFCETIKHPKGEVVELTVMTAENTGVGLTVEE